MNQLTTLVWSYVFLAIVISSSFSGIALANDRMVLLCDDRPPFHYINAEGKIDGYAAKAIQCSLEKMGYAYEIRIVPWKRAQAETKWGSAHSFFAASRNATRDEYAQLSRIIIDQHWSWLTLKTSGIEPASDSFKEKARTGSWLGSNSMEWLKKNNYKIDQAPVTAEQLVRQLLSGRIDAAFASDVILHEVVDKIGVKDQVRIIKQVHRPWGVYISKKFLEKHSGFMEKFNETIQDCLSAN